MGWFCLKHVCLQSAYSARTFRVATAYLDRDLDPGAHFCIFVSSRFPSISTDSSDVDTFRTMSVVFYRTLKNQSDFYRFIFCFYFWGCLYIVLYTSIDLYRCRLISADILILYICLLMYISRTIYSYFYFRYLFIMLPTLTLYL